MNLLFEGTVGDASMPLHALRRWRIRRLYNQGNWCSARQLADREIGTKNHQFASEIIVRSMFNDQLWQELIAFAKSYPEADSNSYAYRAKRKLVRRSQAAEKIETPNKERPWNASNLLENWMQEGQRLWLRHPWGWVYWDMPEGYNLSETHPALLHLALEVLLSPWVPTSKKWTVEARERGTKHSLSFSGGVDSTAAMILMPEDTILSYHQRDFASMLSHSLPHYTFSEIKKQTGNEVICILSNHEKIRTHSGMMNGFSTANASGVHLILLADFLDLQSIAFGTPIDNTWLKKGSKYRDFSQSFFWKYWSEKFNRAGLDYVLPINHLSEAGALSICSQSPYRDVVNSCLRGHENQWCGRCWKCFHKNGPLGRAILPDSEEITTFLHTAPLRTAQHALWALKKQGLEDLAPHLKPHISDDLSWWEQAYPLGIEILPESLKEHILAQTEIYLKWMEEPYFLETTNLEV
jgi:hypothetical protein